MREYFYVPESNWLARAMFNLVCRLFLKKVVVDHPNIIATRRLAETKFGPGLLFREVKPPEPHVWPPPPKWMLSGKLESMPALR